MIQRTAHGFAVPPEPPEEIDVEGDPPPPMGGDPEPPVVTPDFSRFSYLLPKLQKPASLLPASPQTLDFLTRLGVTMLEAGNDAKFDSDIPSAYTYFGQFIDHDISQVENKKPHPHFQDSCVLGDPKLAPVADEPKSVSNKRKAILELDCVYGGDPPPPRTGDFMTLMNASKSKFGLPAGKDAKDNDLYREPKCREARLDRVAHIGDRRNDQNLIISQLHVAFLRAHNAIVSQGKTFKEAQRTLLQHYHYVVVYDFLKKHIAHPEIVEEVLSGEDLIYNPTDEDFFIPLEFTAAAFRFGHSMIRSKYYLNDIVKLTTLGDLFTLTALSSNGFTVATPWLGFPTLPDYKLIHWRPFLKGGANVARKLDTRLVEPLFTILDETEQPVPCERRLAVQDLKRGYMMRMPTGQAVARALQPHVNAVDIEVLTPAQIKEVAADNPEQLKVLEESGFLLERTPLWFYILAEAAHGGGNRLGPVGSRLVAEVIIQLIRRSKDSFLATPGWKPSLPAAINGDFTLPDLLSLAGVLEPKT